MQIASALDAAHAHDLVHRDVKPGNILIAEGTDEDHPEHVYLTDFGLTKKSLSLTGFTTVGQFVGTLDYVAPEQISGHPVDGRCDVYSLGCVVFEMLTAAAPFRRDDDLALLWAHLYSEPPRLTPLRPELPAVVDDVIGQALAKSPGTGTTAACCSSPRCAPPGTYGTTCRRPGPRWSIRRPGWWPPYPPRRRWPPGLPGLPEPPEAPRPRPPWRRWRRRRNRRAGRYRCFRSPDASRLPTRPATRPQPAAIGTAVSSRQRSDMLPPRPPAAPEASPIPNRARP